MSATSGASFHFWMKLREINRFYAQTCFLNYDKAYIKACNNILHSCRCHCMGCEKMYEKHSTAVSRY